MKNTKALGLFLTTVFAGSLAFSQKMCVDLFTDSAAVVLSFSAQAKAKYVRENFPIEFEFNRSIEDLSLSVDDVKQLLSGRKKSIPVDEFKLLNELEDNISNVSVALTVNTEMSLTVADRMRVVDTFHQLNKMVQTDKFDQLIRKNLAIEASRNFVIANDLLRVLEDYTYVAESHFQVNSQPVWNFIRQFDTQIFQKAVSTQFSGQNVIQLPTAKHSREVIRKDYLRKNYPAEFQLLESASGLVTRTKNIKRSETGLTNLDSFLTEGQFLKYFSEQISRIRFILSGHSKLELTGLEKEQLIQNFSDINNILQDKYFYELINRNIIKEQSENSLHAQNLLRYLPGYAEAIQKRFQFASDIPIRFAEKFANFKYALSPEKKQEIASLMFDVTEAIENLSLMGIQMMSRSKAIVLKTDHEQTYQNTLNYIFRLDQSINNAKKWVATGKDRYQKHDLSTLVWMFDENVQLVRNIQGALINTNKENHVVLELKNSLQSLEIRMIVFIRELNQIQNLTLVEL